MKEKNSLPCNRVINVDQVYKSGQLVKCIFNGQVVYMNKKDCKALWRGITVAQAKPLGTYKKSRNGSNNQQKEVLYAISRRDSKVIK